MNQKKSRVLIVDDEPKNVRLLEAMIIPLDIETRGAFSGAEALEMLEDASFDAVLLDINMPYMNGIEVCKKLKENKKTRNIPVVFVTAYGDVKNQACAMEAGGIGFITKPVEDILIAAGVRNAIRIKELSDEVEELNRQRQSLSNMIVHDISNLLQIIIVNAELTVRKKEVSPDIKEIVTEIKRNGREIYLMTESLLYVEKMESGAMEVSIEALDGWKISAERAQAFSHQAEEQEISIQLNPPGEEAHVRADRALLSRIFDNLLGNAVKFCPRGGSVEIDACRKEGMWAFVITNDGKPIPSEYHSRIFEKFSQVEVRQSTDRKGVGLGLTFCTMAVEAMGGTIAVESPAEGRKDGVSFIFTIPCAVMETAP